MQRRKKELVWDGREPMKWQCPGKESQPRVRSRRQSGTGTKTGDSGWWFLTALASAREQNKAKRSGSERIPKSNGSANECIKQEFSFKIMYTLLQLCEIDILSRFSCIRQRLAMRLLLRRLCKADAWREIACKATGSSGHLSMVCA